MRIRRLVDVVADGIDRCLPSPLPHSQVRSFVRSYDSFHRRSRQRFHISRRGIARLIGYSSVCFAAILPAHYRRRSQGRGNFIINLQLSPHHPVWLYPSASLITKTPWLIAFYFTFPRRFPSACRPRLRHLLASPVCASKITRAVIGIFMPDTFFNR